MPGADEGSDDNMIMIMMNFRLRLNKIRRLKNTRIKFDLENGNLNILNCFQTNEDDDLPILREEVEASVESLKKVEAAGIDNIPPALIKSGGDPMVDSLICNKVKKRVAHNMDTITYNRTTQKG